MDSFRTQREDLGHGKIPILQDRAVVLIAAGIAQVPGIRCHSQVREIRLVESRIRIAVVLLKRSRSNDVGAVIELVEAAKVGGAVKYREGGTGLDRGDPGDLPTAKHLTVHTVVPSQEAVAGSNRQVDHEGEYGAMANIERRGAALRGEVGTVGKPRAFASGAEVRRTVIDGLPEGVRAVKIDAVPSLVPGYSHRPAVVRVAYAHACPNRAEEWVRENLCAIDDLWLVPVDEQPQLVARRTLVVDFE